MVPFDRCPCSECQAALAANNKEADSQQQLLRQELEAVFKDYARHETEQGNHFLAGTWNRAAEIVAGYVTRKR